VPPCEDTYHESGAWAALFGDCLDRSQLLPDGCADLVLIDPPYGTMAGITNMEAWADGSMDWDQALGPAALLGLCSRLLRPNGKAVIFSQEPYTSRLTLCPDVPPLPYGYRAAWHKNSPGVCLCAKKALVGYFEDILLFSKICPKHDHEGMDPSRPYFAAVQEWIGKSIKTINAEFGHRRLEHTFYHGSSQFLLCGSDIYDELVERYRLDEMPGFVEWPELAAQSTSYRDELVRVKNEETPSVFNLPAGKKSKSNVFTYPKDGDGFHPTQKPVALLVDLIETFSRPGDLVVDFTAGSFSTGVAAIRSGRRFVGIEKEERFFQVGVSRLQDEEVPNV